MRPWIQTILKWLPGAIAGLLLWCGQVGPQEAASNLSKWANFIGIENIPKWLVSKSADAWASWLGFIGFLVWAAWFFLRDARFNPRRKIQMPEAATTTYEQLRAHDSLWASAADRFSGSNLGRTREEGVLLYIATAFTTQNVPLYGKRPPSRLYELINPEEFKRGTFSNSGAIFSYHGEKHPRYVEIAVEARDLGKVIAKMRNDCSRAI